MTKQKKLHPIDVHVGIRLKNIRELSGSSRQDLGNYVELSGEQIRKYEVGENRISASKLYEIGMFFNKPVNYFFEGYLPPKQDTNKIKNFILQFHKNLQFRV